MKNINGKRWWFAQLLPILLQLKRCQASSHREVDVKTLIPPEGEGSLNWWGILMISLFAANGHLVFETTLKGENTARSQALAHHTDKISCSQCTTMLLKSPSEGGYYPWDSMCRTVIPEKCALGYYPRVSVRSVRVCVYAGGNGAAQHTKYLSLTIVSISRYWLLHEACSLPWNGDCLFSRSFKMPQISEFWKDLIIKWYER